MTNTRNTPIEALERAFPLQVRRQRQRSGSGGAGEAAGGEGIELEIELLADATVSLKLSEEFASCALAYCDMRTLYLRNVPDEVGERLERLAAREGLSVSAFATRELAVIARRADNPALLADLPDLGVDPDDVVAEIEAGRAAR